MEIVSLLQYFVLHPGYSLISHVLILNWSFSLDIVHQRIKTCLNPLFTNNLIQMNSYKEVKFWPQCITPIVVAINQFSNVLRPCTCI